MKTLTVFRSQNLIRWRGGAEARRMDPREALNHPLRRQILRALIATDEPLGPPELVATLSTPGASVSAVSYHAKVLESAGAVGRAEAGGADADRYRAASLDPDTIALLESTRDTDATF